jgi:hypothetical protein
VQMAAAPSAEPSRCCDDRGSGARLLAAVVAPYLVCCIINGARVFARELSVQQLQVCAWYHAIRYRTQSLSGRGCNEPLRSLG